jgi:hypothetical protein
VVEQNVQQITKNLQQGSASQIPAFYFPLEKQYHDSFEQTAWNYGHA